jgi:putative spermidine/putrescine transport system ATP-binding protein
MARLELQALSKRYGDFHAVRGVSLDVADGEFWCCSAPRAAERRPRCA